MEPKLAVGGEPRRGAWLGRWPWAPAGVAGLIVLIAVLALGSAASAQSGPTGAVAATPWATNFCLTPAQCLTGDFNGDGMYDIISFSHNWFSGQKGWVWVSLSNGSTFDTAQLWQTYFCAENTEICKVGDFNGDGMDDIAAFSRGTAATVWVALSTGNGFGTATVWNSFFCPEGEICDVGDYNGDGKTDIATFTRSLYYTNPSDPWGRVYVALSNGSQFVTSSGNTPWRQHFCYGSQLCGSGDFNGDGRDDIIAFDKTNGPVWVSLSTGSGFASSAIWNNFFCPGQEVCGVGDFNGDGRSDIITYLRSAYAGYADPKIGYVYVALSNGSSFPSNSSTPPWKTFFCINSELCGSGNYIDGVSITSYSQVARMGDFNGDSRFDAITFLRSTDLTNKPGYVYVAPSTGSQFVDSLPSLPKRGWLPLVTRQ
jgi:hypothetical protein